KLAQRFLGDARRAAFLADLNNISVEDTLAIGEELTMLSQVAHTAGGTEPLSAVAQTYYGDAGKAELLRRYNFRAAGPLKKGQTIFLPVSARAGDNPDAERKARKVREATAQAREVVARALEAWHGGDYAKAREALAGVDLDQVDGDVGGAVAFLSGM